MYKYKCLNPIAKIGLNNFTDKYEAVDNVDDAEGILVEVPTCWKWIFPIIFLLSQEQVQA